MRLVRIIFFMLFFSFSSGIICSQSKSDIAVVLSRASEGVLSGQYFFSIDQPIRALCNLFVSNKKKDLKVQVPKRSSEPTPVGEWPPSPPGKRKGM